MSKITFEDVFNELNSAGALVGNIIAGMGNNGVSMFLTAKNLNPTPTTDIQMKVECLGVTSTYEYNQSGGLFQYTLNPADSTINAPYISAMYQIGPYGESDKQVAGTPNAPQGNYSPEIKIWFESKTGAYEASQKCILKLNVTAGTGTGTVAFVSSEIEAEDTRPQLSAPTFSISGMNVSILQAEGASVRYTLDGSEPSEDSTLYSAPFAVEKTTIIKAIGIDTTNTYRNSEISSYEAVPTPESTSGPFTVKKISQLPNNKIGATSLSDLRFLLEKDNNLLQTSFEDLLRYFNVLYGGWTQVFTGEFSTYSDFSNPLVPEVFYNREMNLYCGLYTNSSYKKICFASSLESFSVTSVGSFLSAEISEGVIPKHVFFSGGKLIGVVEESSSSTVYTCSNWEAETPSWSLLPISFTTFISPFGDNAFIFMSQSTGGVPQYHVYNVKTNEDSLLNDSFPILNSASMMFAGAKLGDDLILYFLQYTAEPFSYSGVILYSSDLSSWEISSVINGFYPIGAVHTQGYFYATKVGFDENNGINSISLIRSSNLNDWETISSSDPEPEEVPFNTNAMETVTSYPNFFLGGHGELSPLDSTLKANLPSPSLVEYGHSSKSDLIFYVHGYLYGCFGVMVKGDDNETVKPAQGFFVKKV